LIGFPENRPKIVIRRESSNLDSLVVSKAKQESLKGNVLFTRKQRVQEAAADALAKNISDVTARSRFG
jgi:hypothetical protein